MQRIAFKKINLLIKDNKIQMIRFKNFKFEKKNFLRTFKKKVILKKNK